MYTVKTIDDLIQNLVVSDKVFDCYVATPYSHPNIMIRKERFERVTSLSTKICAHGFSPFSPITHSHPMAMHGNLPGCWEFWEAIDMRIMPHCEKLVVLMLTGWDKSVGVEAEVELFKRINFAENIIYFDPY